ncbi:hypothetical protein IQ249_23825 [Lusitaniella coriacea LEGE 07157]|uniref:JmjC domain-containing protein n=1 Tax=Lusitaniella coriacea LEGE 07157 TaxID=945747 RepID=A0A8J7IXQ7_9CYAN|nr:hypothetical protein [Lusitaniella coriacea]MBE9118922.1 hypothetical protein [Lusitaniella coriacea LEGE 07157]
MNKKLFFKQLNLYPTQLFKFIHSIESNDLLLLNEIIKAAAELPTNFVEYYTFPFQISKLPCQDIKQILISKKAWIILRHLEYIPRYNILMSQLLNELKLSELKISNKFFNPASFIFISSPNFITPFHIDPEHNFLFQITGKKEVLVNDASVSPLITSSEIEDFYADEFGYSLSFSPDYLAGLTPIKLDAGEGVYIPFTFPHMVFNGNDISISYSLTFRTKMSEHHRRVHLANRALGLLGLRTKKYGESQFRDSLKSQLFPLLNFVNVRKKYSDF